MIDPLVRLPDGTVKQVNPISGTKVWTLPGRGARPLGVVRPTPVPLHPADHDRHCAFCWGRMLETPPEIARVVRECSAGGDTEGSTEGSTEGPTEGSAEGPRWRELRGLLAEQLGETTAEFRLFPNLFEILSYDYWHLAHGFDPTPESQAHRAAYLATPLGRDHVTALARVRMRTRGATGAHAEPFDEEDLERESVALFAGNHQVVVARRHFVDGAVDDSQNAGSGSLTPEEHCEYTRFTIGAIRDLYRGNPHARYVSAFQNWLRPAGASFEHLHKQLVAIDELGTDVEREAARLQQEPELFTRWGADFAEARGLVVARTPTAVAFAGIGHQYPTLAVHTSNMTALPWELSDDEVRDFSDLLHACHAATGSDVPTNEEWHHGPPSLELPIPLRALLKWRVSTPAGFEGGTKIYVNTIDPWTVRDRTVARLRALAAEGRVSARVTVA